MPATVFCHQQEPCVRTHKQRGACFCQHSSVYFATHSPGGPATTAGNPVPVPTHIRVTAAQLKPGRLILTGDIHGCCEELRQLLEVCKFDPARDNLVLLGDIVNKGPDSPQVSTHPCLHTQSAFWYRRHALLGSWNGCLPGSRCREMRYMTVVMWHMLPSVTLMPACLDTFALACYAYCALSRY
jgi:hypothetical protein